VRLSDNVGWLSKYMECPSDYVELLSKNEECLSDFVGLLFGVCGMTFEECGTSYGGKSPEASIKLCK